VNVPGRILVIRRKAIGDVLVSLPLVQGLADRWPGAAIDFVVDEAAAAVVFDIDLIDRVLVYPGREIRSAGWASAAVTTWDWLCGLRRGDYDLVIDLMGTPQTAAWSRWTGAPIRVGRARRGRAWAWTHRLPARGGSRFAGEVFLDALRILGVDPGPWKPTPAFADLRWQGPGSSTVMLNPSATWSAKAWPARCFAELGRSLRRRGHRVLVAWGPGEEESRDHIVRLSDGAVEALPPTDLRELCEQLCSSELLVTTDNGPKHLAVAHGVPTLTLFGSTNPQGWQPPLSRHRWLTHSVDCHPCDLRECPVAGHPCLDELASSTVEEAALAQLAWLRSGDRVNRREIGHG